MPSTEEAVVTMSPLRREIRRIGPYRVPLGPARLFLDDIEDIVRYLKQVESKPEVEESAIASKTKEQQAEEDLLRDAFKDGVAIMAVNAIADSVKDLSETTHDELEQVTIFRNSPVVEVDLWKYNAEVLTYPNDTASRNIAEEIAAFVRGRRTLFSSCRGCQLLFTAGIVGTLILAVINFAHSHTHWYKNIYIPLLFIGVAIIGTIQDTYLAYRHGTVTIVPSWRNEKRILTQQSRQTFAVALLGAVAGSLVTWLLAR